MSTLQLEDLRMPLGAKPNQAILFVDLSEIAKPSIILSQLEEDGYQPQIRHLELKGGLRVVAVLRDESDVTDDRYEQLLKEWESLATQLTPSDPNKSVRLWRGVLP